MSAPIPDAAVEAVARAMYADVAPIMKWPTGWDHAPETIQRTYRDMARAGLAAARDLLVEDAVAEIAERDEMLRLANSAYGVVVRERDEARAALAAVAATLADTSESGVSCGGLTIDADGCYVADLAVRIRAVLADHTDALASVKADAAREHGERIAQAIAAVGRQHDAEQIGFSAKGDTYADAARIARATQLEGDRS